MSFKHVIGRGESNSNPFSTQVERTGHFVTEQFEAAIVVDVIVNNHHTEYASDGYNVGAVKFRFINSNYFQPDETLHWAFSMDANRSDYPLLNELVYVFQSMNRFYYFRKFNVSNRPTAQGMFGLNEESQPVNNPIDSSKQLRSSAASPIKSAPLDKNGLGEYFIEPSDVYRLKHIEGDLIYEGRTGQSIRMGSAWKDGRAGTTAKSKIKPWQSSTKDQAPNMLIRVGPDPKAERTVNTIFGQVVEDINTDMSSLWIVSDQVIPLKYSTESSGIHRASIVDFPNQLNGNQIVINTDRFVVNTKTGKILGHSSQGIHWTTLQDYTVDANRDHRTWTNRDKADRVVHDSTLTVGRDRITSALRDISYISNRDMTLSGAQRVSFLGSKVYIGSYNNTSEPLVLGITLQQFLNALISALTSGPLIPATSSPGSPSDNPALKAKLTQLKAQYLSGKILSDDNFTVKTNDQPLKATNIQPYTEG